MNDTKFSVGDKVYRVYSTWLLDSEVQEAVVEAVRKDGLKLSTRLGACGWKQIVSADDMSKSPKEALVAFVARELEHAANLEAQALEIRKKMEHVQLREGL